MDETTRNLKPKKVLTEIEKFLRKVEFEFHKQQAGWISFQHPNQSKRWMLWTRQGKRSYSVVGNDYWRMGSDLSYLNPAKKA